MGRSAVLAVLVALVPSGASAANGLRPRTLATFELEQCLTVIDAGSSALHVDFSIPFEDATRGPDELDDSRTFQFFALCRDHHAELEPLPNWIAQDDLDRSLASEIITELPPDDDVLDLASTWTDCAWRLVPDDARMPITCDATQGGVDFDASALPVGNYVVRGYTFEPSINVWVPRRGVVQVRGEEPLPVVSLMSPPRDDWQAYEADGFDIVGCMDGPPGTSVRIEWASLIALEWTELATLDAAEQTFSIHFDFPPQAVGQPVIVRATATAGSGEAWTAFAPGTLIVLPGDGDGYGPEPPPGVDYCGFFPDAPDPTTGGSSGDGSTSGPEPDTDTEEADTEMGAAVDRGGCGCRAARERDASELALAFVLALGALGPRRRRAARRVGGRSPASCARVAAV